MEIEKCTKGKKHNFIKYFREKSEEMLVRLVEQVIDKINKELQEQEYWKGQIEMISIHWGGN